MKITVIFTLFFLFISNNLYSVAPFDEGKELFLEDNVEEAIYLFEEALITDPNNEVYKYLAESYTILGFFDDAALVLEEAISSDVGDESYFHFKLGNAYFSSGDYKNALNSYLEVITRKGEYVKDAFLNVANVSVELKLYGSAIDNYTKFLELSPNDPQKRKIVKMILLLKKAKREEDNRLREENELKLKEEMAKEESRIADSMEDQKIGELEAKLKVDSEEASLKERELIEQRLLFDVEQDSLKKEYENLRAAEEKVINPPDPDIEAKKAELKLKEEELKAWEERILERERALEIEKASLESTKKSIEEVKIEAPEPELSEEEVERLKELDEMERLKKEEDLRQQALMNDILQSLEKIGQNAKTINAESEEAIGDLEGSDIDE